MTAEEYFGDWMRVIDMEETAKIIRWLNSINLEMIRPYYKNIFKAFGQCPYESCDVVMVGQDPYPQPGVATGILFGNSPTVEERLLSPSLKVVKKAVNATSDFDNTMKKWARQGILMINSALTCKVNQIGSHVDIWRPFVSKLIHNLSRTRPDIIFVMFGAQAQSFNKEIGDNTIINVKHPAYYARMGFPMPSEPFEEINRLLVKQGKPEIIYT